MKHFDVLTGYRLPTGQVICYACQFLDKYTFDSEISDENIVLPMAILDYACYCLECEKIIASTKEAINVMSDDIKERIYLQDPLPLTFSALLLANLGNALLGGKDSHHLNDREIKTYLYTEMQ